MLLIPAIDLKDGHCVRLKQGAMEDATVFSEDPAAMAGSFISTYLYRMKDLFSSGASEYARFRPQYPDALFDYVLSFVPGRQQAWDAGCGNGQTCTCNANGVCDGEPSGNKTAFLPSDGEFTYQGGTLEFTLPACAFGCPAGG